MPSRRPTHKIKASECGGARKGDALSPEWAAVDCPACIATSPRGRRPSICQHCGRLLLGSCVALHYDDTDRWLHADCAEPWKRSREGRVVLAAHPNPFESPTCPRCGVPGGHDGAACWRA